MNIFKLIILLLICIQIRVGAEELIGSDSIAVVNVIVNCNDGKSHIDLKFTFEAAKTKKAYQGVTDKTGNFSILLPEGDNYKVIYSYFGSVIDDNSIDIPSMDGEINFNFKVTLEAPKVITLDNVFFDTNKSILKPESFEALDNLVLALESKEGMKIEIAGHTDNVGDETANLKLSQARAESVRKYLINKKISPDRVTAKGYGPTIPIANNETAEGRKKNRRTEVKIL